ncbi:Rv3235 family protein [Flexivirga sp. B27]
MSVATAAPLHLTPASGWQPPALDECAIDTLFDDVVAVSRNRRRGYSQPALRVVLGNEEVDPHFGPQATRAGLLPEPRAWLQRIAGALLECMTGVRSTSQIARWVSPLVYERVNARSVIAKRRGARPLHRSLVRRVTVCEPDDGVVEASVVIQHDGRVRAMALRMVGVDGRWMVTAMELG